MNVSGVAHIADHDSGEGDHSFCGRPLKPYTFGSGQVCQLCADLLKQRKAARRGSEARSE